MHFVEADREAGLEPLREAFSEGRWLSYSELAEIRCIGRPSAVKLAQRERWRRIPGNDRDRTVRVLVPPEWLQPSKAIPLREAAPDGIPDAIPEFVRQLDAANARVDEANKRADAALARADRTLGRLADMTGHIQQAESRMDAANQRAVRAEARTNAAEEAARKAQHDLESVRRARGGRAAGEGTPGAAQGRVAGGVGGLLLFKTRLCHGRHSIAPESLRLQDLDP